MVRTLNLQSTGRGFDSRPPRCRLTSRSNVPGASKVTTVWRYKNLSNLTNNLTSDIHITETETETNDVKTENIFFYKLELTNFKKNSIDTAIEMIPKTDISLVLDGIVFVITASTSNILCVHIYKF